MGRGFEGENLPKNKLSNIKMYCWVPFHSVCFGVVDNSSSAQLSVNNRFTSTIVHSIRNIFIVGNAQ